MLVGHRFGGNSISAAADRVPDRIRQLVYLDGIIQENGQSAFSMLPKQLVEARIRAAQESSNGLSLPAPPASSFGITDAEQVGWVDSHLTPHPFATYSC